MGVQLPQRSDLAVPLSPPLERSLVRSRGVQYACILVAAVLLASLGSHLVAAWLKIKVRAAEPFVIGKPSAGRVTFLAGSSVADYGVDWEKIAQAEDLKIHVWGIAAGSPVEHEQFQQMVPEARTTFIAVSAVDLDEALISDFRAAIVPLSWTITSLIQSGASLKETRQILSQYPITWLRSLFPTLGRSRGILGAARIKIKELVRSKSQIKENAGPVIKFRNEGDTDNYRSQRMSDWTEAEVQNKVVAMRVTFKGQSSFNGLKHLAFQRMLNFASQKGRTVVVVLPASPAYKEAFLPTSAERRFEESLSRLKDSAREVTWLRADQMPELSSAAFFCDLTHLNQNGKNLVTDSLLKSLSGLIDTGK